jgi:hypothetical protein
MAQEANDTQGYELEDETDLIEFYFDQGVTGGKDEKEQCNSYN